MIKLYEGAGVYKVHFTSGKSVELTEEEIAELQKELREELAIERSDAKLTINELEEVINKVNETISPYV